MGLFINSLNNLYERLYRVNFTTQRNNKILWSICNVGAFFLRKLIRYVVKYSKVPQKKLEKGCGIIVSISSFPNRFPYLRYTLLSVLNQSLRPEKIVVNLTEEECPKGRNGLPYYLLDLERVGVEYAFLAHNLKPHNKYYYTLQKYKEKMVVTLDDDTYYRYDVLSQLYELHKKYPQCICSNMVRKIEFDSKYNFLPYNKWNIYNNNKKGHQYLALGMGGVLYPPHVFDNSNIFNLHDIKKLALSADDLWLKANEILLNIEVVTGTFKAPDIILQPEESNVGSLSSLNVGKGRNDIIWEQLDDEYKLRQRIPI